MPPLVPILACHGMGLALLLARGADRDPALASALALPVGAAATAALAFAFTAAGIPLTPAGYLVAWCVMLALAAWAARRQLRSLTPAAAGPPIALALLAIAAARFDLTVASEHSHDVLLAARVLASGGEARDGGLSTSLFAAFFLVAPGHVPALVSAIALSAPIALAVLVARAVGHRLRAVVAPLAALALVSWFPLARSFLTVGSPALAGLLLLVAGGLWYACEAGGRPGLLPVALLALVGFALAGGAYAIAAGIWLLAMAAGTRLTPRALAWRWFAVDLHPALRLAIAAALVWFALAFSGHSGLVAVAPVALFALVALAGSRNPAHSLATGERELTADDLRRLVIAWNAGVGIVSALEWGVLLVQAGDHAAGPGQELRLLPLGFGNLLPYGAAAAVLLTAAEVASRRWARGRVAIAAAALALPYAIWLARFTFSGPQASAMAYRPLLIGLCAALVAAGFAAVAWFAALRSTWRRWPAAVIAALVLACLVVLVTSGAALVNEYLPLHQFLALWSLLFAILAGREVSRLLRLRLAPLAASAALLFSVGAGAFLAHAHADAWLLWSETGASRYLTRRWSFLTPSPAVDRLRAAMIVKPDLESTAAAERRAVRAAAVAPDIVVFSIDGLRMDRVGAYGTTRRQLTPTIDRFAARGVRFTRAFSSSPKTQVFNSELLLGRFVDRTARAQQPAGFHAEAISNLLKRRDYHIFVKGWFDQSLGGRFDPAPFHIDTYAPKAISAAALEEPMQEGLARVAHHLEEARALGRPALIWIHLLATHPMDRPGALGGYVPHPEFDFGDAEVDRYESAVAGSDRWLAGLEELFATSERPTAWFILSDHGVNTGTRTRDLHEPLVRVPLVVVAPGARAAVDDHLVDASLDLAATIVDLAGIAPPADYDGVSLVPLLVGLPAPSMDARLVPLSLTGWSGAVHGRFKYLRQGDVESLFDLAADPGERHNLIGQEFERAFAMSSVATRELERRRQAAAEARRAR